MDLSQLLIVNALVVTGCVFSLWLLSLWLRDSSVVDIFWGFGFVVIAWASIAVSGSESSRRWLTVVLTTLWGLRLAGYLAWRNHGKGEDYRYQEMREKHGKAFWWVSLFTVFLLQGAIMWLVSLPIQAAIASNLDIGWLDFVGCGIWAIGLMFETVGDIQLARFKADPANAHTVLNRGLWRYTRHPNYFGDFLVWWGLFLIAASSGNVWTIVSPLAMSFFLMKVSGVTLLEKKLVVNRPGYREYVAQTNAFFPGPRRRAIAE